MINIRFFGSNSCVDCLDALNLIRESGLKLEYIDALNPSDKIQKFCDVHVVDTLPHIQFLYEDDEIIFEHTGEVDNSLKNLITYFKTKNAI